MGSVSLNSLIVQCSCVVGQRHGNCASGAGSVRHQSQRGDYVATRASEKNQAAKTYCNLQ